MATMPERSQPSLSAKRCCTRYCTSDGAQTLGALGLSVTLGIIFGSFLPGLPQLPHDLRMFDSMMGQTYFFAWAISFLPQIILNWRRQSVDGLSVWMVLFGAVGFVCLSMYTISLYAHTQARREYAMRYHQDAPVQLADVTFSVYGVVMELVVILQILLYGGASLFAAKSIAATSVGAVIAIGGMALVAGTRNDQAFWLDWVTYISYFKLAATIVKYCPQVWLNYKRRSTTGFHILGITLDLTGGLLSLSQLFLECAYLQDWSAIQGNPAKFGLGLLTLVFDIALLVQHYVLYAPAESHLEREKAVDEKSSLLPPG